MDEELHLIVRLSEDGKAYATSPQAPGLVFGRQSHKLLRCDLDDVLSFYFDRPGPFHVVEHIEWHYVLDDGELVIRVAQDASAKERATVAQRIADAARMPEQARSLVSMTNAVGEAVYVCAVPSDTLGWLSAQIQPGDRVTAALAIADGFLFTLPVAADGGNSPASAWAVERAPETQLSEIMRKTPVVTPQHLGSLELC